MKKRFLQGTIVIGVIMGTLLAIYYVKPHILGANQPDTKIHQTVAAVDQVVRHPDKYKGPVTVSGKLIQIDESDTLFSLGCEDACVAMPVRYAGTLPPVESDIIIYGKVIREDGKYLFEAESVGIQ